MATPPDFRNLQRLKSSSLLRVASIQSKVAAGVGASVGRGNFPPTPSVTATPTVTPTLTPSVTPTFTPTSTVTPTVTPTYTPTVTPTYTPTMTPTVTPTWTLAPQDAWVANILGPIEPTFPLFQQNGVQVMYGMDDASYLYFDRIEASVVENNTMFIKVDNVMRAIIRFNSSRSNDPFAYQVPFGPTPSKKFYQVFSNSATFSFYTSAYPRQPGE